MKTYIIDPKKQPVNTKDNLAVKLDSSIFYRIISPKKVTYKLSIYV